MAVVEKYDHLWWRGWKTGVLTQCSWKKKTYTAILEISMKIPQKTKDRTTTEPTIVLGIAQVWGTVEQA